jgi:hypothetical protein
VNELEKVYIYDCLKLRIRPHLPRAASWSIRKSDNVLLPQRERVSHIDCLIAGDSNMPLYQWGFLYRLLFLRQLILMGCTNLMISPEISGALHSLQELTIWDHKSLEKLPNNMRQLTKLESLTLSNCPSFRQLPQWLGELLSLKELKITSCNAIMTLPESIQELTNLQELKIFFCSPELKKWCNAVENHRKLEVRALPYCLSYIYYSYLLHGILANGYTNFLHFIFNFVEYQIELEGLANDGDRLRLMSPHLTLAANGEKGAHAGEKKVTARRPNIHIE